MLSIKLIGSSNQEVGYYADLGEDYYVDGGEPPGKWWGSGANELGLFGTVDAKTFRNVLQGHSPDGKKSLVQNAGKKERRAAFDLTFTVPKSVSIVRIAANKELATQIDEACDKAAKKAFEAVQSLCGLTRRGGAGRNNESAKLMAAVFRHETARALKDTMPDPNLHYHMVLCNLCVREDGTTGTFDGRILFRRQMKMALGALFRAELSKQLHEIGLPTYRPENDRGKKASWFEVQNVPEKLISTFSKRRNQIVDWMKANGVTGAKAAEKAALSTRESKSCFSRDDLKKAWRNVCSRFGLDSETLKERNMHNFPSNEVEEAQKAVEQGLQQLANERGHFTETDLLRYAAQEAQCQRVGIKQITTAVKNTLTNEQMVVPLQIVNRERRYTTPEMLQIEKDMFASARRSIGDGQHLVSNRTLVHELNECPTLRPEQSEAIRHMTTDKNRISCVNGMAGTGKTFMLQVARKAWEGEGFQVLGTALAAKAAQELKEGSGMNSIHIHRLLHDIEKGNRKLHQKTVLVVDEAGMIGTRLMAKLVSLTEQSGSKLVLVGDHKQLQAIDAGAPFRGLAERLGVVELKEITRQRERWARKAVTELAAGHADSALKRYAKRGLLRIAETQEESITQLVNDWKSDFHKGIDTKIFAATRMQTYAINQQCQRSLREAGTLGHESLTIGKYQFHKGDHVVVTKNNAGLMLKNGTHGIVESIDQDRNEIRIKIHGGLTVRVNPDSFPHIDLGYCTTTHKGQGQTVESAFVLAGGSMTDRELSYVQGSRARGSTRFYTDRLNGGADIQQLADQMARSRAKDLVHDYIIEAA